MARSIVTTIALVAILVGAVLLTQTPVREAPATPPAAKTDTLTGVNPESVKTTAGEAYTIYHGNSFEFTLDRPSPDDKSILLAIAATYTSPGGEAEGLIMVNGEIVSTAKKGWDGATFITNGRPEVFYTNAGEILHGALLADFAKDLASLFQGHLLVHDGEAQTFRPQPFFQRRAIATMSDGNAAIIESVESMGLNTFAGDLVSLGVSGAMNLDMGNWAHGWYRDSGGKIHIIGCCEEHAAKQTNWLVIRR